MIELGKKTNNGISLEQALKGDCGASAYEVAVNNGFVGTEQEWLLSLKGKDGKDGEKGEKGAKGDTGARGADGAKGDTGAKGDKGDTGAPFTYDMFTPEQLAALKGEKGDKGDKGEDGEAGASKPTVKTDTFYGEWAGYAIVYDINSNNNTYIIDFIVMDVSGISYFENKVLLDISILWNDNEWSINGLISNGWFSKETNINMLNIPFYDNSNSGFLACRLTNCTGALAEMIERYEHNIEGIKVYYIEVNEE